MLNQGQQLKFNFDNDMAQEHVRAVHEGNAGYIAFGNITDGSGYSQRHYLYEDFIQLLKVIDIDVGKDYYFSPNTFYIPKRLLENVKQIRSLYVDIDCHNVTLKQAAGIIDQVLSYLSSEKIEQQMPEPSAIVKTGRGAQLYWFLIDLPKHAVPFWKMVQDALTDKLTKLLEPLNYVDVDNVSDIARILRLSGTNNTKANQMAVLVKNTQKKYRLDSLVSDYFPELNTISRQKKEKTAQSTENGRIHRFFNLYSLHYARLNDLVKLLELRKGQVDSDECRRRMVFLYRYWGCCYLQDAVRALEDALLFNSGFTTPLPKRTVIRETASAEKAYLDWLSGETVNIKGQAYRKGYNYKNSTLINWLNITPEEQREMQTIIGTEEKYRRNDKRRYGKDENGLTENQRQRIERDKQILDMHEQGLSNCEIARRINISEGTVRNTLKSNS